MSEIWVATPAAPSPTTSETDLFLDAGMIPEDCYTCKRRLLGSEDDKKYHLIACADLHEKRAKAQTQTPAERLMPWAINPATLTSAECGYCGSIIGLSQFNQHLLECKSKSSSSNPTAAVQQSPLNVSPPAKKMKTASSSEEEHDYLTSEEDSDGFTHEEAKRYSEQVGQSDGFDVDDFSHRRGETGVIIPVKLTQYELKNCATPAATRALTEYNRLKHKDFELVEIEKMNSQPTIGIDYYITFKAKSGGIVETFEARVWHDIVGPGEDPYKVELCRIKDVTA